MKYILSITDYEYNLGRQRNTFIPHRILKADEVALYNKNAMNYSYWKVVGKHPTKHAYILERGNCPNYWGNTIKKL